MESEIKFRHRKVRVIETKPLVSAKFGIGGATNNVSMILSSGSDGSQLHTMLPVEAVKLGVRLLRSALDAAPGLQSDGLTQELADTLRALAHKLV